MADFESWLNDRGLTLAQVLERLGLAESQIDNDAGYSQLTGLSKLYKPDLHPGRFYFQEGHLVLLYISGPALQALTSQMLEQRLGVGITLRSRSGKLSRQYVYPEQGVAFSADKEKVHFLEIFPPMTLEDYKERYYQEPPAFVR